MKAYIVSFITAAAGLGLFGCETAHDAAHEAGHVAKKGVHVAGHAVEKAGHVVAHGGEEIEEHTAQ